jgi:hypothetical protein
MTAAKLKTMADCIEDGIRLFDSKDAGWLARTNSSRLRPNSNLDCVLHQAFGPGGEIELGLAPEDWFDDDDACRAYAEQAVHRGIYASDGKVDGVTRFNDTQLTNAWARRLIQLKAERGVS